MKKLFWQSILISHGCQSDSVVKCQHGVDVRLGVLIIATPSSSVPSANLTHPALMVGGGETYVWPAAVPPGIQASLSPSGWVGSQLAPNWISKVKVPQSQCSITFAMGSNSDIAISNPLIYRWENPGTLNLCCVYQASFVLLYSLPYREGTRKGVTVTLPGQGECGKTQRHRLREGRTGKTELVCTKHLWSARHWAHHLYRWCHLGIPILQLQKLRTQRD